MKAKAPEKIYRTTTYLDGDRGKTLWKENPVAGAENIEYIRTDVFIEKALKWYCRDCECNDNCTTNCKCAFRDFFKDYLEGNDKALPPKISNAFNPDGSTTEDYRYRHIIERMQDDFIDKAVRFIRDNIESDKYRTPDEESYRMDCRYDYFETNMFIDDFKNYMKGE